MQSYQHKQNNKITKQKVKHRNS